MRRITNILSKNWAALIVIIAATFFRFYRLGEFATFLADEGRDAIIIKRIVTFEHWPAIGAPTSVGHVFLGPFYYYFIAPWLLIFNFNPSGLAYGMAVFSTVSLIIFYFLLKKEFGSRNAFISLILASFSYVLIDSSRFSWNPNPLPFFSFLTAYFFIKAVQSGKYYFFILFGAFLSFSIQLHYLALGLALPMIIYLFFDLYRNRSALIKRLLSYSMAVLSFTLFISPLIIFDLRHDFLNSKSLLSLLESGAGIGGGGILKKIIDTFSLTNLYLFNVNFGFGITITIFFLILIFFIFSWFNKNKSLTIYTLFFFGTVTVVAFYPGPKHSHYLGTIYLFYIILIGTALGDISKQSILGKALTIIFLACFTYLNVINYNFLRSEPNNQIGQAKEIAQFIKKKIISPKFNFAVQPDGWQEDSYLYFLELDGKVPQDRRQAKVGDEMIVVCGNPCDPVKSRSWNITMFGKAKIEGQWQINGVTIYRLVHDRSEKL